MAAAQKVSYSKLKEDRRYTPKSDLEVQERLKVLAVALSTNHAFAKLTIGDMEVLADWGKAFHFEKGCVLAKKYETVDYVGVILSGKAFWQSLAGQNFCSLDIGKVIGGMAALNIEGALTHTLDVVGEVDGYIWCLRLDEYKALWKLEPQTSRRFASGLACWCIELVHYQFYASNYLKFNQFSETKINEKKIVDLLESCDLKWLWERFERREQRAFLNFIRIVEMTPKLSVVRAHSPADFVLFLLKGELTQFSEEEPVTIETGRIFGFEEFLLGREHRSNIFCKSKGYLAVITRSKFDELAINNIGCAAKILEYATFYECLRVRRNADSLLCEQTEYMTYELPLKGRVSVVEQKSSEDSKRKVEDKLKQSTAEVSPLFHNDVFKKKAKTHSDESWQSLQKAEEEKEKRNQVEKEKDKQAIAKIFNRHDRILQLRLTSLNPRRKDTERTTRSLQKSESKERLESQSERSRKQVESEIMEMQQEKAQELSLPFQNFYSEKADKVRTEKKETKAGGKKAQGEEDQYERIKADCRAAQLQNKGLKQELEELSEELKGYLAEINRLKNENVEMNSKVQMSLVLKELASSQGVREQTQAPQLEEGGQDGASSTLNRVLLDQLDYSAKYKAVVKCAYRWLFLTKRRLKSKKQGS